MKQLSAFIRLFMLPMCLVLIAAWWAGGCIRPSSPLNRCARPKVLVFSALWCAPCQRDKVVLVQVEAMGVEVQVVDIDAHSDLARKYGVTSVPTYFIYTCGHVRRTNDVSVVVDTMQSLFRR